MAVVTMPTTLMVGAASWGQVRFDIVEQSETTGSQSVRLLGPPRWKLEIQSPQVMSFAEAGKWEALLYASRGRVNHIAAFDPGRVAPAGTARGAMRLYRAATAGENSVVLIGGTNGTLLAGDALQIGAGLGTSQLVKLAANAESDPPANGTFAWDNGGAFTWTNTGTFVWDNPGLITITFEAPLRLGFALDTAVTYSYPVAYFKAQGDTVQNNYPAGFVASGGYALQLLEAFA